MSGETCSLCYGIGWVLDWGGGGRSDPACLELLPCIHPECPFRGVGIETLDVHYAQFRNVVPHPVDGTLMAVNRGV